MLGILLVLTAWIYGGLWSSLIVNVVVWAFLFHTIMAEHSRVVSVLNAPFAVQYSDDGFDAGKWYAALSGSGALVIVVALTGYRALGLFGSTAIPVWAAWSAIGLTVVFTVIAGLYFCLLRRLRFEWSLWELKVF